MSSRELQRASSMPASQASRCRVGTAARGSPSNTSSVFFDDACKGRVVPSGYMVSIGMLGPTLLDHGTEEMKLRHLPRILRGDEEWIQLLSEPSGGSDMASAITRLTRDGDSYVLNGAKMWSTGAAQADYGHVPGAHRLGRAEAPGSLDDRRAPQGHAGCRHRADQAGHRCRRALLPGVLRRRRAARREPHRCRERRLGGRADPACATSAWPPPVRATATASKDAPVRTPRTASRRSAIGR